jgi:hypothetical protein
MGLVGVGLLIDRCLWSHRGSSSHTGWSRVVGHSCAAVRMDRAGLEAWQNQVHFDGYSQCYLNNARWVPTTLSKA